MFRGRDRRAVRRVADRDPTRGRRRDVDGIDAGTERRARRLDEVDELGQDGSFEPDQGQGRGRHRQRGPPAKTGSGRPRTSSSIANSPPASGSSGSGACDPPPPMLVTKSVERSGPPNAGIVGFRVGTAICRSTSPSGVTRRTAEPYTQAIQYPPSASTQAPSGRPGSDVKSRNTRSFAASPVSTS